ncbi:MAG: Crp/Fnr family transcriptional regulator [Cyclobacteriaceae bacterium]|nr:Crp/Fnr family transcriptional regulator [Cyclobacteriaceae bacterium]
MSKEALSAAIRQMITISDEEIEKFLSRCRFQTFQTKDFLGKQGEICQDIFFITKGTTRSLIIDTAGEEHTIHFSLENQFICDYTSFMLQTPATNSIQAVEETHTVVLPRNAIEWGYNNLQQGDKMGRLIAEYYFIYFDNRLKNQYLFTPAQRYENLSKVFPNIHNRVPQHMIASYLGVSPVHLSRLKKSL